MVDVVCEDWISSTQEKKLNELVLNYGLDVQLTKPTVDQKPHCPPFGMAAFSESIMQNGALVPIHSFVEDVLDYYNIAPFQLTLNSFGIIVAFHILYGEVLDVVPTVEKIGYFYDLKKVAQHLGFYYLSRWAHRELNGIGGTRSNMGEWKMRYFFYPSERPGGFRIAELKARPELSAALVEQVATIGALPAEEKDYRNLTTDRLLQKYYFFNDGVHLPAGVRKRKSSSERSRPDRVQSDRSQAASPQSSRPQSDVAPRSFAGKSRFSGTIRTAGVGLGTSQPPIDRARSTRPQ